MKFKALRTRFAPLFAAVLLAASVLTAAPQQVQALTDGFVEEIFVETDLLSPTETRFFDQKIFYGQLLPVAGAYAVIFPEKNREPLIGYEAEKAFKEGKVKILSFSGLPNSFSGSMNMGKLLATINQEPVLAFHSGYGDLGPIVHGAYSFFAEREYNAQGLPYADLTLTVPFRLLDTSKLAQKEITLVGYCLGAYKAANLAFWLKSTTPETLKKVQVLSLGVSVRLPEGLRASRQLTGNRDEFGRINSTNPWDAIVIPGSNHTLRRDHEEGLTIPPVRDLFGMPSLWLPQVRELETYPSPGSPLGGAMDLAQALLGETELLLQEARGIFHERLTGKIHLKKLEHRKAYLSALLLEIQREELVKSKAGIEAIKAVEARLRELRATERSLRKEFLSLETGRTSVSDMNEYVAWKERMKQAGY